MTEIHYALGDRINDPITNDLSSGHLIENAEQLIAGLNDKQKEKVQVTTLMVWIRTAIRLAKKVEELEAK